MPEPIVVPLAQHHTSCDLRGKFPADVACSCGVDAAEIERRHQHRMSTYEAAMDAWKSGGRLGPPPPRPVPPHTPGPAQ